MSRSAVILLLALATGCAGSGIEARRRLAEEESRAPRPAAEVEGAEPYALRVNRTLIYPVQWGRAEDMAETLRPLIEGSYGPGTVVIAHPESNHLLIHIPPPSARGIIRERPAAPLPPPPPPARR